MAFEIDIREILEKHRQKVVAVAGTVAFILLTIGLCWFAFRKKYNLKPLEALRASQSKPTRDDLEKLAPLLSHPDPNIRVEVHGYFRQADPEDIRMVAQQEADDPVVAAGLDQHYREIDPAGAVRAMGARLKGAKDKELAELYGQIASTGIPEALPFIEEGLDKAPDGVKDRLAHEVAINPKLYSPRLIPKLQALARDKSASEAIRRHAARALKSIAAGKPQQLPYDIPLDALGN